MCFLDMGERFHRGFLFKHVFFLICFLAGDFARFSMVYTRSSRI